MDCPEGIIKLSKHYKIVIPKGVEAEIKKSPGRERLQDLARQNAVQIVKVNQSRVGQILKEHPQLHRGECEAIALIREYATEKSCIVSDDSNARRIFQMLNFEGTKNIGYHEEGWNNQ